MFETFGIQHLVPLLHGLKLTLVISGLSMLLGTVWGACLCAMRLSRVRLLSRIATAYTSMVRGIPLLILLFTVYYTLPILFPAFYIPKEVAAIVSLVVYAGAYLSEIIRGAIQSIHKGQTEASQALGMTALQRMRHIIFPQAIRIMLPPYVGFFISLIKDSALVSIINFVELTRAGKIIGNLTMSPLITYAFVALFYFVVCFGLSRLAGHLERRFEFRG